MDDLKKTKVSKRRLMIKVIYLKFHLHETSKIGTSIETESRLAAARG